MKRSPYHTSMAATLAVGSELSRRGYNAAFTLGNMPRIDLLCGVPDGESFKVQVKGISHRSALYIQKAFLDAKAQRDLFLIVVWVPLENEEPFRFFVLSHQDAKDEAGKMPRKHKDGRPIALNDYGLYWGSVTPYENKWGALPKCRGQ